MEAFDSFSALVDSKLLDGNNVDQQVIIDEIHKIF